MLLVAFVEAYLRLEPEEERQFIASLDELPAKDKEKAMEFTTSWHERGRQQGRQEGRREEARSLLERQLAHRFGPLSPRQRSVLSDLSLPRLEALAEGIFELKDVAALDVWLDADAERN